MPKTKFQGFIFTAIMVFLMVLCMTVYTLSLSGGGLDYNTFLTAIKEMWLEYVIVFLLEFFVITNLARKLALRIVDPEKDNPFFMILAVQSFTVLLTVPVITLIASAIHGGFTADIITRWLTLAVQCFPMAFFFQIFIAGPVVRFIFQKIFIHNN